MYQKKSIPVQLLRNQNIEPSTAVIADVLGKANKIYVEFVKELKKRCGITLVKWRFYNDGKAWLSKGEYKWTTARGTEKVKPIFWLSIWEGFFKVSFFFSADVGDELQKLPISADAKEIIKNAKSMGKTMRFMPVIFDIENDGQLNDIYEIAGFRKKSKVNDPNACVSARARGYNFYLYATFNRKNFIKHQFFIKTTFHYVLFCIFL